MSDRKTKDDVMFKFMSQLLKAGETGVIANSQFARMNGWLPVTLHLTLRRLIKRGVVICTSKGQDKRVTIGSGMRSHADWLLAYYGSVGREVADRYQKYLGVKVTTFISADKTMSPTMMRFTQVGAELVKATNEAIEELQEENRILKQKLLYFEERMREINKLSS